MCSAAAPFRGNVGPGCSDELSQPDTVLITGPSVVRVTIECQTPFFHPRNKAAAAHCVTVGFVFISTNLYGVRRITHS